MNMQEFLDDVHERLNRAGPPDEVQPFNAPDFERPDPVNLGRSRCAHCERWVTEAGKYDHNLSKHPEIYK